MSIDINAAEAKKIEAVLDDLMAMKTFESLLNKQSVNVDGVDYVRESGLDIAERLAIIAALQSALSTGKFHEFSVPRLAKELFDAAVMLKTGVTPLAQESSQSALSGTFGRQFGPQERGGPGL